MRYFLIILALLFINLTNNAHARLHPPFASSITIDEFQGDQGYLITWPNGFDRFPPQISNIPNCMSCSSVPSGMYLSIVTYTYHSTREGEIPYDIWVGANGYRLYHYADGTVGFGRDMFGERGHMMSGDLMYEVRSPLVHSVVSGSGSVRLLTHTGFGPAWTANMTLENFIEPGRYALIIGGNGSGEYPVGNTVNFSAIIPDGQQFLNWSASGVVIPDLNSESGSFLMPDNDVTLTANFEPIPPPPNQPLVVRLNLTNPAGINYCPRKISVQSTTAPRFYVLNLDSGESSTFDIPAVGNGVVTIFIDNKIVWTRTNPEPPVFHEVSIQIPPCDPYDPTPPDPTQNLNSPAIPDSISIDSEGNTTRYFTDAITGDLTSLETAPDGKTKTSLTYSGSDRNDSLTNSGLAKGLNTQASRTDADARARDKQSTQSIAGAGSNAASNTGDSAAKKSGEDIMANASERAGTIPGIVEIPINAAGSGNNSVFEIFIPGINKTIDLDPTKNGPFMSAFNWFKSMIIILTTLYVIYYGIDLAYNFQVDASGATQTQGLDGGAVGGFVSAPTGLIYATGLVAMLAVAATVISAFSNGFSFSASLSQLSTGDDMANKGSILSGGWYLIKSMLPIGHLVTTLGSIGSMLFWKTAGMIVYTTFKTLLVK